MLELKYAVLKVKSQLEFLVDLCGIDRAIAASSGVGPAVLACPKGLRLLTRLFDGARQAAGLLHEPLAIAVFAAGTGPFLRSVFMGLGPFWLPVIYPAGLLRSYLIVDNNVCALRAGHYLQFDSFLEEWVYGGCIVDP